MKKDPHQPSASSREKSDDTVGGTVGVKDEAISRQNRTSPDYHGMSVKTGI